MQNGEPGTNETAKSQGPGKLIEGNKMSSREVADYTFQAIIDEKFYIFTHPEEKYRIQLRMEDIMMERNPTNPY